MNIQQSLRNSPSRANNALSVLSKAFNLAEVWGISPEGSNPYRHVRKYPIASRERFLTDEELGRLGRTLDDFESRQLARPSVTRAVRLLALTGCRLGEILNLRWDEVDLAGGGLRLSETKTGPRVHSIGAAAQAMLAAIPRIGDSPWVLPHSDPSKPLPNDKAAVLAAYQKGREVGGRAPARPPAHGRDLCGTDRRQRVPRQGQARAQDARHDGPLRQQGPRPSRSRGHGCPAGAAFFSALQYEKGPPHGTAQLLGSTCWDEDEPLPCCLGGKYAAMHSVPKGR